MGNTTIGAEAAKLAGLQIDLMTKLKGNQVTMDQLERFLNLTPEDRELRFCKIQKSKPVLLAEPAEKFALLVDLGPIVVPADYVHSSRLKTFGKQNRKKFYSYDDDITDPHFSDPTRILKPGDKLHVCAFKQIVGGTTTSEERMEYLRSQKAVFTGAQGASLVWEQRRDLLPKGKWYASFDEPNRLWKVSGGDHRVPYLSADSGGGFGFDLGGFENVWNDNDAFLCFRDVE